MTVKQITQRQKEELSEIAFSKDGSFKYYPCQVKMINGEEIDNVYIVEENSYRKSWGTMPDEDSGKKYILIENVESITESPNRLEPRLANKIYEAGESGMGYCLFKIVFENGEKFDVASGNAVDFMPMINGMTAKKIVDVLPHEGSRKNFVNGPEFYWCLYKK